MARQWATAVATVSACICVALAPLSPQPAQAAVASPPKRILCLSASATQMLYEIGAGRQVVGVDKYSTWPAGAPRTKLTGYETSAEDYFHLHPDLVIFAFSEGTLVKQLSAAHIRALVLPPAATMADVDAQLAELGEVTGHLKAARKVEVSLAARLAAAAREARGRGKGKSYYIELDPTYYTATSHTFIGAELSIFGMRDIADAAGKGTLWPQVSAEYVLKEDPEYVFLADSTCCHQNAAAFAKRPGFALLRAVKLHHVIAVDDSVASEWGPHTIDAFVTLVAQSLAS